MRVHKTPRATADIEELVEYISRDSVDAALRVLDRIETALDRLAHLPERGRPGRYPGTRELVVTGTSYIIVYKMAASSVQVLHVVHASRSWPPTEEP